MFRRGGVRKSTHSFSEPEVYDACVERLKESGLFFLCDFLIACAASRSTGAIGS